MTNEVPENRRLPGRAASYWIETAVGPEYPAAPPNYRADVVVIGGGIAGLTAAHLLKRAGKTVVVIEGGRIAADVTGHTTAKLTSLHRLCYRHLIDMFDERRARQYAEANQAAIDFVESTARENGIDCDFVRKPAYTYAQSKDGRRKVTEEVDAALRLGLPAHLVENLPLPLHSEGAIRFDGQAQFHPRKYLLGIAKTIPGEGSAIFEGTRVLEIADEAPISVRTTTGTVHANDVIQASHWPVHDRPGLFFSRMHQSASYVLGVRQEEPLPDGMFINVEEPSRSLRSQPTPDGELVLVSGEGHRVGHGGDTRDHYRALLRFAESLYHIREVTYRWMTQDIVTIDEVPYIGRQSDDAPHLYVATGFKKWGMTHGIVAGRLLADLVLDRENPWTEVFDPRRFKPTASVGAFVGQQATVAADIVSGLLRSEGHDPAALPVGQGAIMTIGGKKHAIFRDQDGGLVSLDPTCRHMGCLVEWNDTERTWDCPCHGSRYRSDGTVFHGPASRNLKKSPLE
jgi:glycine/D-amino acid oxidase-like deaminating enzyme/nitrite reductase/ring-hydroxylating ferredoxin subunit